MVWSGSGLRVQGLLPFQVLARIYTVQHPVRSTPVSTEFLPTILLAPPIITTTVVPTPSLIPADVLPQPQSMAPARQPATVVPVAVWEPPLNIQVQRHPLRMRISGGATAQVAVVTAYVPNGSPLQPQSTAPARQPATVVLAAT